MRVFIVELKTGFKKEVLPSRRIEVKDDSSYQILVEIMDYQEGVHEKPSLSIGDLEIPLVTQEQLNGLMVFKTQAKGSFFEKALFLNYFGECELSINYEESIYSFIFDVNITSYKASIAKEILSFLSTNADDILQSCYSKSRTNFDFKSGHNNNEIKFKALEYALEKFEATLPSFRFNHKHDMDTSVEFHSNKPPSFDDRVTEWLLENIDEASIASSNNYSVKINNHYLKIELPNSINTINTDKKENHVIHHFIRVSNKYLKEELTSLRSVLLSDKNLNSEYEGYVKFDNVIQASLSGIFYNKERNIKKLISRLDNLKRLVEKYIPVKEIKPIMPMQTSYTLRNKHYAITFEAIKTFYRAESGNRKKDTFLLGLRSLSQLFEFACLYFLVNYFKKFSSQVSVDWLLDSFSFYGPPSDKMNVLGNCFVFNNENYEYTLMYEKKFYSITQNRESDQLENLIRVDDRGSYYEPDFTIKVRNRHTDSYYYIILDAKFSRRYKMNKNKDDSLGILSSIFLKYGNNLKAYTSNGIEDLTKFIGVMYGLKTNTDKTERLTYFNKIHDIDELLPISPFSSADYINFDSRENSFHRVLDKYVQR